MALLIVNSAPGPATPLLETLRSRGCDDEIWLVDKYEKNLFTGHVTKYWNVTDLTFGQYDANELGNTPALDATTIDAYASTEVVFFKMLEKNEKYNKFLSATRLGLIPQEPDAFQDLAYDLNRRKVNYVDTLRFWSHQLREHVSAVLMTAPPNHGYDYIIYVLAKRYRINFLTFEQLPLPGYMLPIVSIDGPSEELIRGYQELMDEAHCSALPGVVREFLDYQDSSKHPPIPSYINPAKLASWEYAPMKFGATTIAKLVWHIGVAGSKATRHRRLASRQVIAAYLLNFWKQIKLTAYKSYYESKATSPDHSCNYVYFPLHYQPEISTSPLGGQYAHPEIIVALLAELLPEGWYLYVREHPMQRALDRTPAQIDAICRYGNVRLLRPTESHANLLSAARAVVTVTGTPGIEALCRGIPVLVFGEVSYAYAPGVFRVRTHSDCERALGAIRDRPKSGIQPLELRRLETFLTALLKVSIRGANMGAFAYSSKYSPIPTSEETQTNIALKYLEWFPMIETEHRNAVSK